MYVFKVETTSTTYIIISETLKEAKNKYNEIFNSFDWVTISKIVFKEEK